MPYIFVGIVWVIPIDEYFYHWDITYLAQKYILCINPRQLWFLWSLFEIFVIIWLLWKLVVFNPILGYVLSIFFYCVGTLGNKVIPNFFCIWSTCQYIPFFYFGVRVRQKEENEEKIIIYHVPLPFWIIFDLLLFRGYIYLVTQAEVLTKIINFGVTFCFHVVGAVMAFIGLQKVATYTDWKNQRWINWLTPYSMSLYLFHQQIIYFVIVWLNGKVNPYINVCANFIIAFSGALAISYLLMKCRITRIFIGEK